MWAAEQHHGLHLTQMEPDTKVTATGSSEYEQLGDQVMSHYVASTFTSSQNLQEAVDALLKNKTVHFKVVTRIKNVKTQTR